MANEVAAQPNNPNTPMQMLQAAVEKGAGIEQMQQLMDLQERWEANNARKAYMQSMTAFKAEPLTLVKSKEVGYGKTSYMHATLAGVVDAVVHALSKHGLSHQWRTEQDKADKDWISVECTITHEAGHSESVKLSAPVDTSGSKNAIQAIGSTVTYLQRYTLMAITGLAAKDMDDDGRMASAPNQYADWLSAINDCASMDELKQRRAELAKAFGGEKKVPRELSSAYNNRKHEIAA